MALHPGTRVGPYEIVSAIGAGGMGEVYRARDTKLHRDVAVKILPDAFAADADRVARFAREAQTLAALNHPNIAQIYGLEDRALVMELVEGEDLSQRISRGALAVDEALPIARQIAHALEGAHELGIIHRDLKPANIKVKHDESVKVLDFGLAKAMEAPQERTFMAHSPTFTSPAMTEMGVILGTAAYMSPEQARGRVVDRRADIWAFGCVLFEMLAGRQPFRGDSVTDVIAAIIKEDPDWSALPPDVPLSIRRLLRRCLQRDPRQRLHDIGDARLDIDEAIAAPAGTEVPHVAPSAANRRLRVAVGVLAAALVIAGAGLAWLISRPDPAPPLITFRVPMPPAAEPDPFSWPSAVLSHDGSLLALTVGSWADTQIHLRALDALEPRPIEGTKAGYNPFFSPDGAWLAFTADQKLKRVPTGGGQAHTIASGIDWGGGTWSRDDVIVYTGNYTSGLWKVPAAGGKPEKLTDPDLAAGELGHWWPQFLPDGQHVVFTSFSTPVEKSRVMLYSMITGQQRVLVEGANFGRVLPSGHLLYARDHGIVGVPFDLDRLEVTGAEAPLVDDAAKYFTRGFAHISVAGNGTMAYIPEREAWSKSEFIWVDRNGGTTQAIGPRWRVVDMDLSPDGSRVAITIDDGNRDVWAYDFRRGVLGRVTSGPSADFEAMWTRDGRKIIFASERPVFQIFMKPPVSTAPEEPLVTEKFDALPQGVTPDGSSLVYTLSDPATRADIWMRPLAAGGEPRRLVATKYADETAAVSPDGKWIAYGSDESGRFELYVQAFPEPTERWQVTTDGGGGARWAADSRRLYYGTGSPDRIAVVPLTPDGRGGLVVGKPTVVFEGQADDFDVAPDGRLLVRRRDPQAPRPSVTVVVNWFEEVRRKLSR